jgi:integrase
VGKLTDRTARSVGPGKHADGDGLYLVVSPAGGRKWVLRYQMDGRRRDMGLGPYPETSLSTARMAALSARTNIAQGIDPLTARQDARKASRPIPTFADIAKDVIAEAQARTSNAKVAYQWERHLGPAYCGPLLARPVNEITTSDVAAVLKPVWRSKPEVARKLYPAIRRVFESARIVLRDQHGLSIENPARWDDLKALGFSAPTQLSRGRHPSLPYEQMAAFTAALRQRDAIASRLLEFLIMTNVRTGTALNAEWREFDLDARVWTIPPSKLKDKKHRKEFFRIPLAPRAVEILKELEAVRVSRFVFPSATGKPLSNMAMLVLLKRMTSGETKWIDPASDGKPIVPHGFRATFRTWCEEVARFPHAVVEEAMGHVVGTSVERAYRRTDVLEQRRLLMEQWAAHCEPRSSDNVLKFQKSGGPPPDKAAG